MCLSFGQNEQRSTFSKAHAANSGPCGLTAENRSHIYRAVQVVLANIKHDNADAFLLKPLLAVPNLGGGGFQRFFVILADNAFAVQQFCKRLQINIGRLLNGNQAQGLQLKLRRMPQGFIGAVQVFFGNGMKLIADAQGKNGKNKAVEKFVIEAVQLYIAKRMQAFDTGKQQQRVDAEFFRFGMDGV